MTAATCPHCGIVLTPREASAQSCPVCQQSLAEQHVSVRNGISDSNAQSQVGTKSSTHSLSEGIDRICTAFECDWQGGKGPPIEDYLHDWDEPQRTMLMKRLLAIEIESRKQAGDVPSPCEYHERFPDLADFIELAISGAHESTVTYRPASADTNSTGIPVPDGQNLEQAPLPRRFGDYELLQEIARGGMGVVYKARQLSLKRTVALKMILAGQLASADDVKRFYTEAEAAAHLDHPGIVPIYEVGQHDGHHFFSMGYVEGESLANRVKDGPLPPRTAANLMGKVADAITYAHERGVIHRDLKPSNILLDKNDQPKVTDFGLAKKIENDSSLTATGQIMGTPSYMPPEQAAGKTGEVGPLSDVYSLGAVLYCLLTGRPPFQAATPVDTMMQVLRQEPVSPRQLNSQVHRDLETICLKCLQKERIQRYASARNLSSDLSRYQQHQPITARPVNVVARAWRWCRRNTLVTALTGTIVVLMVVGTIASSVFAIRATAEAANARNEKTRADRNAAEAITNSEIAQQETHRAYQHYYVAQMTLAQRNWDKGHIRFLLEQLAHTRPTHTAGYDLRGFEWYYWQRLCHSDIFTLTGHTDIVTSVAFSPDGKWIASGSDDRTVKVWKADTGQIFYTLKTTNDSPVNSVVFSPDGKWIASGHRDNTIRVWKAHTGQERFVLDHHSLGGVFAVTFSPNGQWIASSSGDKTVRVWDAETGQETRRFDGHESRVHCVAFSRDSRRLASGSYDTTVKVWDMATSRESLTFRGHTHAVYGVAFSPEGEQIASASWDKTVKVWEAETGDELRTFNDHTAWVTSVAFGPGGGWIASASGDNTVKVWNVDSEQETLTLRGHIDEVQTVAFSSDGQRIVSGSADATAKVWEAKSCQGHAAFEGHAGHVTAVAFSPDGQRVASGSSDKTFSQVKDGTVKVWDARRGQELLTFEGHAGDVTSVAFSPDGQQIATGSEDKTAKVWDAETGEEALVLEGHTAVLWAVAFSANGEELVSGSGDSSVKIWSMGNGQELATLKGHSDHVTSVAFSPDGRRIVSGSRDHTVKLWDVEAGREILTLAGHSGMVSSVAFSPDGKWIVSGSGRALWFRRQLFRGVVDQTVRVWEAATGKESLTLNGHSFGVTSVAFSPDGCRIVSAAGDYIMDPGEIKIWDATIGRETLALAGHSGAITSVAFSPDGRCIVSAGTDRTIRIWDSTPRTRLSVTK